MSCFPDPFRRVFLTSILTLSAIMTCRDVAFAQNKPKVMAGYFEEWSIYGAGYNVANLQNNHVADHITHLLYAFGNVYGPNGADAQCHLADPWADYQNAGLPSVSGTPYIDWPFGNFGALKQLKQLHPKLKILISLGGASFRNANGFAVAASSEVGRRSLAASCIDMFINGNVGADWVGNPVSTGSLFDGLDIDWEFPGAADKHNFTLLLLEFRRQLDALAKQNEKRYLLTVFAPAGADNYTNLELATLAKPLDFLNLQGYDLNGIWNPVTNHAASLFDSRRDPEFGQGFDVNDVVTAYLKAGVPANKLVVGVPLYGYGWTGVPEANFGLYQNSTGPAPSPSGDTLFPDGVATYATLASESGYVRHYDTRRIAQWSYSSEAHTFWTFDDPFVAWAKTVYIHLRVPGGLGGAMVWAFKDDDANGTMVKTLARGLGH